MEQFDALIVSHGQPSSQESAEAALAEYVAHVQAYIPNIRLGSATLAATGRVNEQLEKLVTRGPVYPLFMADGWFVRTCLTGRIGDAPAEVMSPFGMDPALPTITAAALKAKGLPKSDPLLLVAHGSGSGRPAPERAAVDFAKRLEAELDGTSVKVGFLEQAPTIQDVACGLSADTSCLPFFAMAGDHVRRDVHDELNECGFAGEFLPVISHLDGVPEMVARAIADHIDQSAAQYRAQSA